jgi:cytochrome c oxidase assembly protein subunit 15
VTGLIATSGAERQDAGRKSMFLLLGAAAGIVPVGWLIVGWTRRNWNLLTKLTALALLMVTLQAILGGLRVTEISDHFAVIHGCLAQAFFCLLILIVMASSRGWDEAPERDCLSASQRGAAKIWSSMLVIAVVVQLVLGALMRHHHRLGLADTGILRTRGEWIPVFDPPEVGILFLHKYWAIVVFFAGIGLTAWLWSRRTVAVGLLRNSLTVSVLLVAQLMLGVSILLTGNPEHKSFWITNFHVLNGLAILALAFALAVRCRRANPERTLLAADPRNLSASLPESSP